MPSISYVTGKPLASGHIMVQGLPVAIGEPASLWDRPFTIWRNAPTTVPNGHKVYRVYATDRVDYTIGGTSGTFAHTITVLSDTDRVYEATDPALPTSLIALKVFWRRRKKTGLFSLPCIPPALAYHYRQHRLNSTPGLPFFLWLDYQEAANFASAIAYDTPGETYELWLVNADRVVHCRPYSATGSLDHITSLAYIPSAYKLIPLRRLKVFTRKEQLK